MSEWINNNLDTVQLFPPTPFPGSTLCYTMQEQKRILTYDYSLYDAQKVVMRPKNFTPLELQLTIQEMYKSFYSEERHKRMERDLPTEKKVAEMSIYRRISRGIEDALSSPQYKDHLRFLRDAA